MNSTASKKRAANHAPAGSKHHAKRVKSNYTRSILTQTSDKALNNNGELNVEAFIKSREFEIRALQDSMAATKKDGASRAFQSVPRDLRRRTASHNVKRVPKRLRARAAKEMKDDNTPTTEKRNREKSGKQHLRTQNAKTIPALATRIAKQKEKDFQKAIASSKEKGKNDSELATPKISHFKHKRRQINKSWLPTHIWHAKRAKMTPPMEPLWRFAIPLTPTEKTTRVTGRSSRLRGCVAWDTSYMSTICVCGVESSILSMLRDFAMPESYLTGNLGSLWRGGARSASVWLSESASQELIAKPVLFWQPPGADGEDRRLWLRIQPAAFLQFWERLLEVGKSRTPPLKLEDLRFAIGSVEITGPASTEALTGILNPTSGNTSSQILSIWPKLAAIQNGYSLPQGAMINVSVEDPRLGQPHQTVSSKLLVFDQDASDFDCEWPLKDTSDTAPIFDSLVRHKAVRHMPTQSAINKRKANALPGQAPDAAPNDPSIPMLLLTDNHNTRRQSLGSWTLLMPWECVLPTWHSLMHYPLSSGGNPRFGGLDEQRLLHFEDNQPWFPGDFPGTRSGWTWELDQREKRKAEWDRKPKSRRVEWTTLDLGTRQKGELGLGWACDWEYLCNDTLTSDPAARATSNEEDSIAKERFKFCQVISPTLDAPESFSPNGLTTISISLVTRGVPLPCARIYRLPLNNTDLRQKWTEQMVGNPSKIKLQEHIAATSFIEEQIIPETQLSAQEETADTMSLSKDYPVVPEASDLVGFVTAGNFNLAQGKGTGIGCLVWARMVNEAKKAKSGTLHGLCIVRNAGHTMGRLARWEIIS